MCEYCGCGKLELSVGERLLEENFEYALKNRKRFSEDGVFVINVIGSPGSGKTTLIEETCKRLSSKVGFIVGDVETEKDAERLKSLGVPSVQINTKGGCHLDAPMVFKAYEELGGDFEFVFIENVGNLVCPASFHLGESLRVVVLSVTEGEEKPEKYPSAFYSSGAFVLTKIDLLPYVDFSIEKAVSSALLINPKLKVFTVSAKTGEGMDAWVEYLKRSKEGGMYG